MWLVRGGRQIYVGFWWEACRKETCWTRMKGAWVIRTKYKWWIFNFSDWQEGILQQISQKIIPAGSSIITVNLFVFRNFSRLQ